ncbi:MAG: hypothetical protein RIQ52_1771, partial [Pseudomonadota bacterium]
MRILAASLLLAFPLVTLAAPPPPQSGPRGGEGASGCGWGSLLFDGNNGVGAHIAAMSTNASFSNDMFGVSSGTNGCSANPVIHYRGGRIYISQNMTQLAQDVSRGDGETLAGLSTTLGIPAEDQPLFNRTLQQHFSDIYPNTQVSS